MFKIIVCMILRFFECLGSLVIYYSIFIDVFCRCCFCVVVEVEIIELYGYLNKIISLKSLLNFNVFCLKYISVFKIFKCVINCMII